MLSRCSSYKLCANALVVSLVALSYFVYAQEFLAKFGKATLATLFIFELIKAALGKVNK